jgi:outer membrane immunogenic protein
MKTFWGAAIGIAALSATPALAADMAVKAPPPAPVVAIYNWSGFYIGGNGGWAQNRNCWNFIAADGTNFADGCSTRSGGVAGGQIGYRWQTGGFVFGVEGQGDWADLSRTRLSVINPAFSTRAKTDGIGLITGQVGWAWNQALVYVKGGAAVTGNSFSILDTPSGVALASADSTRWGASVGVGFEYGFTPNWSVGVEYDHLFMGHNNNSFSTGNPIIAGALNRVDQNLDMVTVRFNYRFGGWGGYGAPVAARY